GNAGRAAILSFAVTVVIGMVLLLVGAITHGWIRVALWLLAIAIDYAGPAWLTRDRLRGLQHVAVAHFADRYGTFVIICLGESIVAIGVGVGIGDRSLTRELVIIAGIIIFADGAKLTVEHSAQAPMPDAGRLALCGGVALYLVGLAAFRLR